MSYQINFIDLIKIIHLTLNFESEMRRFLIFFVVLNPIFGFLLNCDFKNEIFRVIGEVYSCDGSPSIFDGDFVRITDASGQHLMQLTNTDVKMVKISSNFNFISKMPLGLEKNFENFLGFSCNGCKINNINSNDLEAYKNLQFLQLTNTNLKKIPENLFINTPKLAFIDLSRNKIEIVGENFLINLDALEEVYLDENPCINGNGLEYSEILALIRFAEIFCADPNAITTTSTSEIEFIPTVESTGKFSTIDKETSVKTTLTPSTISTSSKNTEKTTQSSICDETTEEITGSSEYGGLLETTEDTSGGLGIFVSSCVILCSGFFILIL